MSQTTQTFSFPLWRLRGQGWSTQYTASATITVTRDVASDIATVKIDATMTTPSGDSSLGDWQCIASINGALSGGGEKTFVVASAGYHAENSSYTVSQTYQVEVGASDGTLSGQIKFRIGGYAGYQGEYSEAKGWSLTYDTKGTPSEATWSNAYFGNASTITIQRTVPDFRETVELVWQDDTSNPVTIRTYRQSSATTISYTIPYNALPTTAQTRSAKIRVKTYNGDSQSATQIGTRETDMVTVAILGGDTAYLPTLLAEPTVTIVNTQAPSIGNSVAVAGYSKIDIEALPSSVSPKYGATITHTQVKFSDGTIIENESTDFISGIIFTAGEFSWEYTATDSRGFDVKRNGSVSILSYSAPSLQSVSAWRGNSDGTPNESGTYLFITAEPQYYWLNGVNELERFTAKVGTDASVDLTSGVRATLKTDAVASQEYTIAVRVEDLIAFRIINVTIPADQVLFHIRDDKDGIGIGKYCNSSNTIAIKYTVRGEGDIFLSDGGTASGKYGKHEASVTDDIDTINCGVRKWASASDYGNKAGQVVYENDFPSYPSTSVGTYKSAEVYPDRIKVIKNDFDYGQGIADYVESEISTDSLVIGGKDILNGTSKLVGSYGTIIPANSNLNDDAYKEIGTYYCQSNVDVATLTNCPTGNAFMMETIAPMVSNPDVNKIYRVQKLTDYTGEIYIRIFRTTSWESWYKVQTSLASESGNVAQWLKAMVGRQSSVDFGHIYDGDKVHCRLDIVSGSLGSNSPFDGDGYVLTFMWDNSGAWDTQVFFPNGGGHPSFRKRSNGSWANNAIQFVTSDDDSIKRITTFTDSSLSSTTDYGSGGNWYRKSGKTVQLSLSLSGTSATWKTITTLPSGYRPPYSCYFPLIQFGWDQAMLYIGANGNVEITSRASKCGGSVTFIVD